jgi:TolA-binding protein
LGAALLLGLVGWLVVLSGQRKEAFAARALAGALGTADAGNLPQASSELQKVISTYAGTAAAGQAVIVLNQIRLSSGQGELAITGLRSFLKDKPDPRFAVQAAGLLGGALEGAQRFPEAAAAFESAAQVAAEPYLKAEYLNEAARAYQEAGKPDEATRLYRKVMSDYPGTPAVGEAMVRLAELTKGAM